MIKAVIFDLGHVLFTGTQGLENHLEPILGIKANNLSFTWKGNVFKQFLYGKISEDEYWKKIIEKNDWKIDVESLKKIIRKNFEEIKGTFKIVTSLKDKGYKLGILSGHTKEWIEYLREKYDYEKYFNASVYSFQIGFNKPDIRIYNKILEKLEVKPEECIFIDDREEFLAPAKKTGMTTILFKSAEQARKELREVGVL